MGSNVVYLNDKKYMQTLTDRLQEEYEVCSLGRVHAEFELNYR